MFSCSLFVFHRRSFSPRWPLAFLILSPPGYKIFTFFFQRNSSPLYFTSSSISFSVIHVSADIKILSGKRLGFNRCMDGVYEYILFYKHITRERETFDVVSIVQSLDHDILIHRLQSLLGLSGSALQWFRSYLRGRSQQVTINGTLSKKFDLECGVSQDLWLGPLLYHLC